MRCKALLSFAGAVTMAKGQEAELSNNSALADLLRCGYVVPVEAPTVTVKESEDNGKAKRADAPKRKSRRKS